MKLKDSYPQLYKFLGAWFPDADYEKKTDADIVSEFVSVVGAERAKLVVAESTALLKDNTPLLDDIGNPANRYLENRDKAKAWLDRLVVLLEKKIDQA